MRLCAFRIKPAQFCYTEHQVCFFFFLPRKIFEVTVNLKQMQESGATSVPASNYAILTVFAAFSCLDNNTITVSPNVHQYIRILGA